MTGESATDVREPEPPEKEKDPPAVSLGRKNGLKRGKAMAAKSTPRQRSEIAKDAERSRWNPAE